MTGRSALYWSESFRVVTSRRAARGVLNQNPVRAKGQEYAEAKKRQRMLAAQHHRTQPFGVEYLRLARKKSRDHQRQSEEVGEAQHVEIGLVDRIDRLDHP